MRAFFAVMAVVIAALLVTIAVELHRINDNLTWVSGPIKALAAIGATSTTPDTPEARERRIAERARAIRESADESAEVMRRVLTDPPKNAAAKSRPSPKPAPTAAPGPARPGR